MTTNPGDAPTLTDAECDAIFRSTFAAIFPQSEGRSVRTEPMDFALIRAGAASRCPPDVEADARRYRWLCDNLGAAQWEVKCWTGHQWLWNTKELLSRRIDAAQQEKPL